jgi:hypothetical protein
VDDCLGGLSDQFCGVARLIAAYYRRYPGLVMQSTIEDMVQEAGGWRGERFVMPTSSVLLGQLWA